MSRRSLAVAGAAILACAGFGASVALGDHPLSSLHVFTFTDQDDVVTLQRGGKSQTVTLQGETHEATVTVPTVTVTVTEQTTTAPPPPPPPSELKWPAPELANPQTISVPTRGQEQWTLTAGQDYRIVCQDGQRFGPLRFYGGRNLVLENCRQTIDDTTSTDYGRRRLIEFRDQTGTIHLDRYVGDGPGVTEGLNLWTPNAILQVQRSRIMVRRMANNASQHPDIIQTWSGPREVRIWTFTGLTDYQGFLFMRDVGGVYPGLVIMDRVNFRPLPNPAWGGAGYGAAFVWFLSPQTEFRVGELVVETGWWNGTYHKGLKDSMGYRDPNVSAPCWAWREFESDGAPSGPEHVGEPCNTGSSFSQEPGDRLVFTRPATDNIWNLDRTGPGRVVQGVPLGGDYVP